MNDPRCVNCKLPESSHRQYGNTESGLQKLCPVEPRYFTPCQHKQTRGWGMLSSDGKHSDGEAWCDHCGQQIAFSTQANTGGVK